MATRAILAPDVKTVRGPDSLRHCDRLLHRYSNHRRITFDRLVQCHELFVSSIDDIALKHDHSFHRFLGEEVASLTSDPSATSPGISTSAVVVPVRECRVPTGMSHPVLR